MSTGEEPTLVIDALGKLCPIPVIELAKQINDVPAGSVVGVLSDDAAAALDIPAWCRMQNHEYLGAAPSSRGSLYLVRRGPSPPPKVAAR